MDKENRVYMHGLLLSHKEKMSLAGKWMELATIVLSKISETQKIKSYMF
jgi:hypothetical protein